VPPDPNRRFQKRDYEARIDRPFEQKAYQEELTGLRDRLKAVLAGVTSESGSDTLPTAAELAERIQALKSSHTIEAAPERPRSRNASAAEAITARIRKRTAIQPVVEPMVEEESVTQPVEPVTAATQPEAPALAVAAITEAHQPLANSPAGLTVVASTDHKPPEGKPVPTPRTAHRELAARGKAKSDRQLSLF